jgi:hypothetical protein
MAKTLTHPADRITVRPALSLVAVLITAGTAELNIGFFRESQVSAGPFDFKLFKAYKFRHDVR